MKILYMCPFALDGNSGKNRATRQKMSALRRVAPDLRVEAPCAAGGTAGKAIRLLIAELKAAWRLLTARPRYDVFISRGFAGSVATPVARLRSARVVREVHTNGSEEANLIGGSAFRRALLRCGARQSYRLDRGADLRVFNNPALMRWYHERGAGGDRDACVYNGCDPAARSPLGREEARGHMKIPRDTALLVFVGSVCAWHGVDYLVALQKQFDDHRDGVRIVCGGGVVHPDLDPDGKLLNLTPLDDRACADLMRASDACLLPVKRVRVSPGSPLKLYDYILNGGFVITQRDTPGYSDEVEKYRVGMQVDFANPERARIDILTALVGSAARSGYDADAILPLISWDARMREWMDAIERAGASGKNAAR